jgi:predicted  nucleic acid-binding Zn-ribbon protein
MEKSKIIPIILLLIVVTVGFIAYRFYSESEALKGEADSLKGEKARLIEENQSLRARYSDIEKQKSQLEEERNSLKSKMDEVESQKNDLEKKYDQVSREREELVAQLQKASPVKVEPEMQKAPEGISEDYWTDFVKKKAELEARLEDLSSELRTTKNKLAEMDKQNKELSIKIDELNKEKEKLDRDIAFKSRTIEIMSKDLVSEREARKKMGEDLEKMRSDNIGLKRELILANKEKMQLQNYLEGTSQKKQVLEQRIGEIENILKEKTLALEELQENLQQAIKGGKSVITPQEASVELPPIVVQPGPVKVAGLKGEIIAVNQAEKFLIMDIGESSGVRPGMQLKVMRGGKTIGTVSVVETRKDISAGDILEVVSGYTIQEGDSAVAQ